MAHQGQNKSPRRGDGSDASIGEIFHILSRLAQLSFDLVDDPGGCAAPVITGVGAAPRSGNDASRRLLGMAPAVGTKLRIAIIPDQDRFRLIGRDLRRQALKEPQRSCQVDHSMTAPVPMLLTERSAAIRDGVVKLGGSRAREGLEQ